MTTLQTRLDRLEAKHAGPTVIEVWITDDDGRHYRADDYPNGPSLSAAEFDALPHVGRVIEVNYTADVTTLSDQVLEVIAGDMRYKTDEELHAIVNGSQPN